MSPHGAVAAPHAAGAGLPEIADVDTVLLATIARESEVLARVGPELGVLATTASELATGGKRLRSAFCLWGARGAARDSGRTAAGVVDMAAALEMFHLGALVHDDVMDRSDLRRGRPTAHRRFAAHHDDEGLDGDASAFGDAVAVLLGDLCFSWADDLVARAVRSAGPRGERARGVWERMRTETVGGQYLDLLAQGHGRSRDGLATRVVRYKSAAYTVEHPLVLGGTLAGGSTALLVSYAELGLRVGEAFQLRDDVLGVFGDSRETGKPALDDAREGKHTVLVRYAEETGTQSQRAELHRHWGDTGLDARGLAALRDVLDDTGARARVEARIASLVEEAHDILGRLPVPEPARDGLAALIDVSAWRAA